VGICADDKAEAFETGIKAAYTDALKRCARTFGPSLGLALYEKERTTVGVASAAQVLLEEIAALDSADACDAWIQRRREAAEALEDQDRTVLRDAFRKRRNGFASASPSKSLVEVVVEAIAATKSVAELAAVRKQYANQVRSLPAANLDEIKTAANEQERHLLEAE
jgi:recombination DNA repair RAD52 pathway protein